MHSQEIVFSDHLKALSTHPADKVDLPQAIETLGIATPRPVIVFIGGAGAVETRHMPIIEQTSQVVAKVAEQAGAIVISGATDAGAVGAIGRARAKGEHHFPLIGIAPASLVSWPNGPKEGCLFFWREKRGPLESHYTHFILTPGSRWGDESPWIAQAATLISGEHPSVTILINGGKIARQDVAHSLEEGRPVIVMAGTGRWADELAGKPPESHLIKIIRANDEAIVFEAIGTALTR